MTAAEVQGQGVVNNVRMVHCFRLGAKKQGAVRERFIRRSQRGQ